jgi:hypothetical protein
VAYYLDYFDITKDNVPLVKILIYLGFFRPIQLLYLIKDITLVREALTSSLYDIAKFTLVLILVWLIFADFGMSIFKD